jgi:tellurite resistance protein
MRDLHAEMDLRQDQAEAIARGLYAVARADGTVHPREAALISDFFGAATGGDTSALSVLERQEKVTGPDLAAHMPTAELRELFLKTAMLLAYADGTYGVSESQLIGEYGAALGVDPAGLRAMELQVKDFMLSQLSHLANAEGVAEVAKGLKI